MLDLAFIQAHLQDKVEDLALHRCRFGNLTDEEWVFFLQQIEGYQRTKDKLPTLAASLNSQLSTLNSPFSILHSPFSTLTSPWWYPPRISCEQCSSEATARYKASVLKGEHLLDLTGGAGIDSFFFSTSFSSVDFVEKDAHLCFLAQHNLPRSITVHHSTAEDFLAHLSTPPTPCYTIYIDPARRDQHGGKVFRIEDCTPNVVALLPRMREVASTIMIKLSPMLDISSALRCLDGQWQVHIVAVKNEVKEVLLVHNAQCTIHNVICADMAEGWRFEFTREEENNTLCPFTNLQIDSFTNCYLYEPSAAILKAGAYKLVGQRYNLTKLDTNTHLYVSDQLIPDFPGRIFKIDSPCTMQQVQKGTYHVLTRNYIVGAAELQKKLKVREGGTQYVVGTRIQGKPVLLLAERCQ